MASNSKALIQWNEKKQEMDGFGCAQAGWSWHLYAHTKRVELMERLFGENGLRLTTLRGEVFPDYSPAPGEYNFETTADIDLPFDDPIFEEETKKAIDTGNCGSHVRQEKSIM
ncbi:MAG: hypothetical protein LUD02_00790 [Tannerellaceae bacterium]|nr:hypothetical protein [Tannerellaceae bacterium]